MANGASSSFLSTPSLPLSLSTASIIAEQTTLVHVEAHQTMPKLQCPLFGTIGPFEPGQSVMVPLHLVDVLAKERIVTPHLPPWLVEENLKGLLEAEYASEELCMRPHPQYIEIARVFKNGSYNAWANAGDPTQARERVMRFFEDYVALRRRKIAKLNEQLIRHRALATPLLSDFERRRLSTASVDFLQCITAPRTTCTEHLEDILASMNVFSADEHYALQEKAQQLCCEGAVENESDWSNTPQQTLSGPH